MGAKRGLHFCGRT